ncbi:hypothetical protein E2C01_089016 [Portunus trituberculatus]|uniref:Uncharacterized protein n=1 Tax=Portunus trituberculatus TaxID=210409 RepID=A0A5B7J7Q7_PORTR|nr:hypothetical protein [Portunus trituberculatus]
MPLSHVSPRRGQMRVWQVVMVAAALAVAVTEAQRPRFRPPQVRIPSRAELTVAINNVDTVKKALACIEGLPCKLDDEYHVMLQRECIQSSAWRSPA